MKERELLNDLLFRYPVLQCQEENIWNAYEMMADSFAGGGKLLIAGNGGSAADAEHIVGELMKGFVKKRDLSKDRLARFESVEIGAGKNVGEKLQEALPAIALAGQVALSTAYANDIDPSLVFAQQVYGYGKAEDIFLGISTSGNSKNIYYASIAAKAKGMKVIALTGRSGGTLVNFADVTICVPEEETYVVQELHLPVYHCLCLMLEEHFFA